MPQPAQLGCKGLPSGGVQLLRGEPVWSVQELHTPGYGEIGCYGNREIPTPNIDSIATNGLRFTEGYVSAPLCSPSRA